MRLWAEVCNKSECAMKESLDILASALDGELTEQDVLIADFGADRCRFFGPFRPFSQLMVDIVIRKGTLRLTLDDMEYTCTPAQNNSVGIKPMNTVTRMEADDGFEGHMVAIARPFMDAVAKGDRLLPLSDVMINRHRHTRTLSAGQTAMASDYFRILCANAGQGDGKLERIIFQHAVLLFHAKMVKMTLVPANGERRPKHVSRTFQLCERFFELLSQYVEQEHNVEFYAGKLCITPHYLSRITHEYVNLPASRIITGELTACIYRLLRNPDYTLPQIAERLHFFDQSSLGKFFRKHTGKTPAAYRQEFLDNKP